MTYKQTAIRQIGFDRKNKNVPDATELSGSDMDHDMDTNTDQQTVTNDIEEGTSENEEELHENNDTTSISGERGKHSRDFSGVLCKH